MKTNTSNRWLPFWGQHPFKIHMQPLRHACRTTHTYTHTHTHTHTIALPTYTRQQPPSLCSHAHLSYTSCLPCLWAAVCECEAQKRLNAAESYNQILRADFSLVWLHGSSAVPRMWVCLLNDVYVLNEWQRHWAGDTLPGTLWTHTDAMDAGQ